MTPDEAKKLVDANVQAYKDRHSEADRINSTEFTVTTYIKKGKKRCGSTIVGSLREARGAALDFLNGQV